MRSVKTWSNRAILAGWLLMAAGVAAFLSIVFVWAGVVMFMVGVALCLLGGMGHAASSAWTRLGSRRTVAVTPSFVTGRLQIVLSGLGGEDAFLLVRNGHRSYDIFDSNGRWSNLACRRHPTNLESNVVSKCSGPLCQALNAGTPSSGVMDSVAACEGLFCQEWMRRGYTSVAWATFYLDVRPAALAVVFRDSQPVESETAEFLRSVVADMAMAGHSEAA